MVEYVYIGKEALIGEPEPKVSYIHRSADGGYVRSYQPHTIAEEIIRNSEVEESKEQQKSNGYGLVLNGGEVCYSLTDFGKKTARKVKAADKAEAE